MNAHGMLLTALPSKNAAARIARKLIDEKLAACVQMMGIESFYVWKGQTANAPETLLLVKTRTALFDAAIARIKELHPYAVPEIVGTEFTAGLPAYFAWIDETTQEKKVSKKKAPTAKKPILQKPKAHPHGDGQISAKKSAGMRTGISRPMRVK